MDKNETEIKGRDINLTFVIGFEEACAGCMKELMYERNVRCDYCAGSGQEPHTERHECDRCGGTG